MAGDGMKIRLVYPDLRPSVPELYDGPPAFEWVEAKDLGAMDHNGRDLYELTAHALYVPFAPGDIVLVDWEPKGVLPGAWQVRGIEQLEDTFTYDVDFMLSGNLVLGQAPGADDPAMAKIREITESWGRDAWVTQHTGLSYFVSARDKFWLESEVVLCEYVDHVEIVRYPGMEIDFATAVSSASPGDLSIGPWA